VVDCHGETTPEKNKDFFPFEQPVVGNRRTKLGSNIDGRKSRPAHFLWYMEKANIFSVVQSHDLAKLKLRLFLGYGKAHRFLCGGTRLSVKAHSVRLLNAEQTHRSVTNSDGALFLCGRKPSLGDKLRRGVIPVRQETIAWRKPKTSAVPLDTTKTTSL
jgi:hypothetical protein